MKILYGIKRLDDYERWAAQLLAARGWQLEIQAETGHPLTAGWFRTSIAVATNKTPFNSKFLTRWSKTQAPSYPCDPRKYAETEDQVKKLHELMKFSWVVCDSIERGHAEACFVVGMVLRDRFHKRQDDIDAPIIHGAIFSGKQSNAGGGNKGKTHFFRTMLEHLCQKVGSTENATVLKHWQSYESWENAEEHSRPYVWAVWSGSTHDYWYADNNDHLFSPKITQIRTAMYRLRKRGFSLK